MIADYYVEAFTAEEQALLAPHVTNLDLPVFALTNLPQVTAAALFARYSRSSKSLRRLLVDEFLAGGDSDHATAVDAGRERASDLFGRVLAEYGDDSVAQLAGVHLACEQVSQPLAKAIEWGRARRLPGAVDALHRLHRSSRRALPLPPRSRGARVAARDDLRQSDGQALRHLHGASRAADEPPRRDAAARSRTQRLASERSGRWRSTSCAGCCPLGR